MLFLPAVVGLALLAVVIPNIGRAMRTEGELREGVNVLILETDCSDLVVRLSTWPFDELEPTSEAVEGLYGETLELLRAAAEVDDVGELRSLRRRARAAGASLRDGPASWLYVSLRGLPEDPRGGAGSTCTHAVLTIPDFWGETPTVDPSSSAGVEATGGRQFRIDLDGALESELRLHWPGLYRYSHRGHGLLNRILGPLTASSQLNVLWEATAGASAADVRLELASVPSYEVQYVADSENVDWGEYSAVYRGDDAYFGMISAVVAYRSLDYERKWDLLLLAGGTTIGLGVTLLVESLIALLFRVERALAEDAGRAPEGPETAGSAAEPSRAETGDEAEPAPEIPPPEPLAVDAESSDAEGDVEEPADDAADRT
jgi:hypothetical protein